jgi:hypothetical protein
LAKFRFQALHASRPVATNAAVGQLHNEWNSQGILQQSLSKQEQNQDANGIGEKVSDRGGEHIV